MQFGILRKKRFNNWLKYAVTALLGLALVGCASKPQLAVVPDVDIERFMGDWYVNAHIPIFIESEAHNAIERYELNDDGTVKVLFSFNDESLEGPFKEYESTAFVDEDQPGQWGIQFIWPFKADFRVIYLDSEYQTTIIGRQARDYVWVMSRDPQISDEQKAYLFEVVADAGYDIQKIRMVPHSTPGK